MIKIHTLGYPRIGRRRELKKAVEAYWAGKIDAAYALMLANAARVDALAVGDLDLQPHFDGAQVGIGRAAEIGQAQVVVGCEGVAQYHADNSIQCAATTAAKVAVKAAA